MAKYPITWVLVADGKQAQVYAHAVEEKSVPLAGNAKHRHYDASPARILTPIPGMRWEAESPKAYETGRNATGMVFASVGGARHIGEPHIDARREVKQHFASDLAAQINDAREKKRFDRLVLAAPPRMLGEVRTHLSEAVRKVVIAELPKELTQCDSRTLQEHIREVS